MRRKELTKEIRYGTGTIKRFEIHETRYNRNTHNWGSRKRIKWEAFDSSGKYLRTRDRGGSLKAAKAAIDRAGGGKYKATKAN